MSSAKITAASGWQPNAVVLNAPLCVPASAIDAMGVPSVLVERQAGRDWLLADIAAGGRSAQGTVGGGAALWGGGARALVGCYRGRVRMFQFDRE